MPAHRFLTEPPPDPSPCLAWLYRLARVTNEWWWSLPGADGAYLVLPAGLALRVLEKKGVEPSSRYVEALASQVEPFFHADRPGLEAVLREHVATLASDRRLRPALDLSRPLGVAR